MRFSGWILKVATKKGKCYWLSPHAGHTFCDLGILAPHSTQYLTLPVSCMPTDFSSIGMEKLKLI
jgi:hypothetical protein